MARAAARVAGITFVDLYADYPRFDIDVNAEQQRLLEHDVQRVVEAVREIAGVSAHEMAPEDAELNEDHDAVRAAA